MGPSSCADFWNTFPPHTNPYAALGCSAFLIMIPIRTDGIGTTVLPDGPHFILGRVGPEPRQ